MSTTTLERPAAAAYESRFERVRQYIRTHLDDRLDLNTLAEVAHLSAHHWHRVYHAVHGETVADTVKRLRLHRAAGDLAQGTMPVADVARRSGYPNVQSFTRIFKAVYGLPPARYREEGAHAPLPDATGPDRLKPRAASWDVDVQDRPARALVTVDHTGSYMDIGHAFERLYGGLAASGLMRPGLRSFGIYLDDPTAKDEVLLRSKAAVLLDVTQALPAPLGRHVLPAGRCAVLRYRGPYASMRAAYDWLFGEWLPASGLEPADAPVVEEYLNNPRDTAPADLLTDIELPLAW
ncbi:GyrI-like domain-containing protein [Rhizobacter sp. Root1221]|uniref:AraC family transcriptional regulator n=1 Tax=Rhizobacter sp. Root1221 TaxID=1736433 RepID=UPI0006FB0604|nr:AraC family transcriptional regulator [Rhizobacter sp. Root1221]KQV91611.1 hypothetical protein ASC87_05845 [Rhizobacter sp. Root1221]